MKKRLLAVLLAMLLALGCLPAHAQPIPAGLFRLICRDAQGQDVGFVGLHPEGCFGLLEVFPEQRGQGYGAALEAHILRFCLENGRVPYCQVEVDNIVSLNLQKKLGLDVSPETSLFAWNCKG